MGTYDLMVSESVLICLVLSTAGSVCVCVCVCVHAWKHILYSTDVASLVSVCTYIPFTRSSLVSYAGYP